jgi:hypothetical protein
MNRGPTKINTDDYYLLGCDTLNFSRNLSTFRKICCVRLKAEEVGRTVRSSAVCFYICEKFPICELYIK